MKASIRIPHLGESTHEVTLIQWLKKNGDRVERGEPLCEIEADKAAMELSAEEPGILEILENNSAKLKTGTVIGTIRYN